MVEIEARRAAALTRSVDFTFSSYYMAVSSVYTDPSFSLRSLGLISQAFLQTCQNISFLSSFRPAPSHISWLSKFRRKKGEMDTVANTSLLIYYSKKAERYRFSTDDGAIELISFLMIHRRQTTSLSSIPHLKWLLCTIKSGG